MYLLKPFFLKMVRKRHEKPLKQQPDILEVQREIYIRPHYLNRPIIVGLPGLTATP